MKLTSPLLAYAVVRSAVRGATAARSVNLTAGVLLLGLFAASLNSLCSFPDSFSDEGHYAKAGFSLAKTGVFAFDDLPDSPAFESGVGLRPRLPSLLFGLVGNRLGHSLGTARTISFILVWGAVLLWFPISSALKVPPFLGALLLASSERVFWASHVFRPEATLVLANVLLLLVLAKAPGRGHSPSHWVLRGLLNGPLVLAHGNGLVSAVLNTIEATIDRARSTWRARGVRAASYSAGAALAIAAFYLVQVRPVGGWGVFAEQFSLAGQYHPTSKVIEMVRSELMNRWGKELTVVGASVTAKVMRGVWYAILLAVAVRGAFGAAGTLRRLSFMSLGTVVGYTLLVHDRHDIHIAAMVPFFLAPFLAWIGAPPGEATRRRPLAAAATASLAGIGLLLCLHHAVKYRPQVHTTSPELVSRAILNFVAATPPGPQGWTVIGDQNLWFWLRDVVPIVTRYRANEISGLVGDVVVADEPEQVPWLARCRLVCSDPEGRFQVYRCPSAGRSM